MCRDIFYICKIFSNECSTRGNKTLKNSTPEKKRKSRYAYKRGLNFQKLIPFHFVVTEGSRPKLFRCTRNTVFTCVSSASASSCPLNASGRYVAKRIAVDERYVSISLILHRYVIFVINTVVAAEKGGRGGGESALIAFGRSTWRLSDATCAAQRAGGTSRRFVKCTFSTCYRARRSAVKGRLPAMRSAFRLPPPPPQMQPGTWKYSPRRFLNSRTKALHTAPIITGRTPSRLYAQRTAL